MTDRISAFHGSPATTFYVEGDVISQSTAGNYSVVRCYLRAMNGPGGSTGSFQGGYGTQAGHIDGITNFATHSGNPFLPSGVPNEAWRWRDGPYDVPVYHNSDGTHAPIRFAQVLNYGGVNQTTYSGYISLKTIARSSIPALSDNDFDAGDAVTIYTNRTSTSFTHTLDLYRYGGPKLMTVATSVSNSYTWTAPLSLASEFPSATSGKFFIRVSTFSGSTYIGRSDLVFTLRAPATMKPTISNITAVEQNSTVNSIVGKLVQGLSTVKLTVSAAGAYGSTINTATAKLGSTTVNSGGNVLVGSSGNSTVTGTVTDSRARTGTDTLVINALAYSPPAVSSINVRRANSVGGLVDDGTYLRVDLSATISSLINSTQRNSMSIVVRSRPTGGSWTNRQTITAALSYSNWFLVSGGGIYNDLTSWEVEVSVKDKFRTTVQNRTVSTAAVTIDMNGINVGIGKIWERGNLDVAGAIYAATDVNADRHVIAADIVTGARGRFTSSSGMSLTSRSMALEAGPYEGSNTAFDGNEIQARNNGSADKLFLNFRGGDVQLGVNSSTVSIPGRLDSPSQAWGEARGTIACAASGVTTVTFPSGSFTVPPVVVATPYGNSLVGVAHLGTPTATSFDVRFFTVAGAQTSGNVSWYASQATSSSAAG